MEDNKLLIESIDRLTEAVTEVAVKLKRLTNNPSFTPGKYLEILKTIHNGKENTTIQQ